MYQPQSHNRQNSQWQPVSGPSNVNPIRSSDDVLRGVNERVNRAEVICRESETIAQDTLGELAHQRDALTRTRDRVTDANAELDTTTKNLKYIYLKTVTNKVLLSSIILMELVIIGLQLYLKFKK